MAVTDEERRNFAETFDEYVRKVFADEIVDTILYLIEPEPESTCTVEKSIVYSGCVREYILSCGHLAHAACDNLLMYCPVCGAKVVQR